MPGSLIAQEVGSDTPAKAWARALALTAPIGRNPYMTLPTLVDELAQRFSERPALIGEDETLTYRELAARANRFARWALDLGLGRGDVVCVVMHNSPSYLAAWLGITRVGAIAALINTNLVGESLTHAIRVAAPKCILVTAELSPAVRQAVASLDHPVACWIYGGSAMPGTSLDWSLRLQSDGPLAETECPLPSTHDEALYIYTSGTTGLPKAAVVRHHRILQWSYWFAGLLNTSENDRMYNCLPMYHSVGGVVAIGATLVNGGSVVLRRRFSARNFWTDVARSGCTLVQYIGELCRYLLNAPSHADESEHHVRIACGNGLGPDIWDHFQRRFAIPKILEFYAATEANFSLYNCEGRRGAIGRIPPFLAHRFPVALIAIDSCTGQPIRDAHGRCRRCGVDEVGEAIGKISSGEPSAESRFDGYTDMAASNRKILRDVFSAGDAWFRSGDLMRRDVAGFFYFVDRVGDTFRWKGENVSTGEVAEAICAWPEISEAVVYGVEVPGYDGRAGMAAVVAPSGLDFARFRSHLTTRLPDYARPVFVRILNEIEKTETFKSKKHELVRMGFDPATTRDPLFVSDRESGSFVPLTPTVLERIHDGHLRL